MSPALNSAFARLEPPVPTDTINNLSAPVFQLIAYGLAVTIWKARKAGLLYAVTPPSTKMKL